MILTANGDLIQAQLLELSGSKTVPNIYINQKHIGGFSDLNALYEKGDLKGLLSEAKDTRQVGSGDLITEKINSFIVENGIALFSKSWCPYCQKVRFIIQRRRLILTGRNKVGLKCILCVSSVEYLMNFNLNTFFYISRHY